ncbi:MAG: cellulase family glycosylhydrolase [Armatimonadetes bacterium]|nr:cellulase family glycosylhydrolase [Armatimonadota bacterium]
MLSMVLAALCAMAPSVIVVPDEPAIVRQTPAGDERMITLALTNPSGVPLRGLRLEAGAVRREILDVPPGGAHDTVWVPVPAPARLPVRLVQDDAVAWQGELAIPLATATVRIPRSPCVGLADLQPLSLRGTNYYPRVQPWPGLWRAMDETALEAEFRELDGLNINWIRTFYNFDPDAGLHRRDGSFTATVLARVETLLRVAARHRVKVMLTIGSAGRQDDLLMQRRFFRTGVEPFLHDGRILMWDLMNEPGGNDGPKATPELARWLADMWAYLAQLDTQHLATVGLAWQFDQLWSLGVKPPVAQYHHYSGSVGVQPAGQPPVRNAADDLRGTAKQIDNRPLIIGEFGYASAPDDVRRDATEARQEQITRWVIEGVEDAVKSGVHVAGVANWCAFHFKPDWMGKGEQSFGVIRLDGSLKPAGVTLRDTYARWREARRAPWE